MPEARRSLYGGFAIVFTFSFLACYHATVETGRSPNGVRIEERWASSFIYGLVPPDVVEAAAKCPDGLARVETRLGFLNQVVGVITLGIYTPMEIVVSCAGSTVAADRRGTTLTAGSDGKARTSSIRRASAIARETERPVYVKFRATPDRRASPDREGAAGVSSPGSR